MRYLSFFLAVSVVFLGLFSGCLYDHATEVPTNSDSIQFTVKLDDACTIDQRKIIQQSADDWSKATSGAVVLNFIIVPTKDLQHTSRIDGLINVFCKFPGDGLAGWTVWNPMGRGAYIYIHPDAKDEILYLIAAHEFGHAFHLEHYEGPSESIMNASPTDNLIGHIPCRDVVAFCEEWNNCKSPYCL